MILYALELIAAATSLPESPPVPEKQGKVTIEKLDLDNLYTFDNQKIAIQIDYIRKTGGSGKVNNVEFELEKEFDGDFEVDSGDPETNKLVKEAVRRQFNM
ncbi:hypothetical protein ECANGB1_2645 [Enterospora canceri]|uniref:Uncharacterized protein n=1 Tax=Enterospora canceri TaxID=1081671 RepID=A0A1Y1S7Z7_9MICR|nr:hypothetical protein ECANGB1_2645 [Enterospora canceri]